MVSHWHISISPWHTAFWCYSSLNFSESSMSSLRILYHNCIGRSTRNFDPVLCWGGAWLSKDIFVKSNHSWILFRYHMDYISFESFRLDAVWWIFGYCSLPFNPDFLESLLCFLSSSCDGGGGSREAELKGRTSSQVPMARVATCICRQNSGRKFGFIWLRRLTNVRGPLCKFSNCSWLHKNGW